MSELSTSGVVTLSGVCEGLAAGGVTTVVQGPDVVPETLIQRLDLCVRSQERFVGMVVMQHVPVQFFQGSSGRTNQPAQGIDSLDSTRRGSTSAPQGAATQRF
jgi:hypothetical protein